MTAQSEAMKKIVAPVHVALKERGFRKRGNGFNREVEPGTVQIIRFQMGRFDPPGTVEIPRLRYNLYGLFTVNVAIYLDTIRAQQGFPATRPAFVDEGGSHLRQRLGELMDPPGDCWWSLDRPGRSRPARADLVLDIGLTWLESLIPGSDPNTGQHGRRTLSRWAGHRSNVLSEDLLKSLQPLSASRVTSCSRSPRSRYRLSPDRARLASQWAGDGDGG